MTGFKVDRFLGEAPKIKPRSLPPSMAQAARNCNLQQGTLSPLKSGLFVWTPTKVGTIKTIYRFGGSFWFHWTEDVDVVRSPIAGDTEEKTYYTGTEYPRMTYAGLATAGGTDYPMYSYRLGVLQPSTAPAANLGAQDCTETDKISALFVYTYVTDKGEEGPPSAPSDVYDICPNSTININGMVAPSGNYNIASKRIYCAFNGVYQFVAEIAAGLSSTDILFDVEAFNEPIDTTTWFQPPDNMIGLIMMPNGVAVGFAGNEIMPSEPFVPYAFPEEYRLSTDYPIIGIASAGQSIIVGTAGKPYLISGADPAGYSMVKLESNQACVSKRSMVDMGDYVVYASPDGLVAASAGGQVNVATEKLITREQWQALAPASVHGYYWEGAYVGFYDTGAAQGGFIFDPSEEASLTFVDVYATAGFNALEEDALYLVVGGNIVRWDGAAALTYLWKSKLFDAKKPINMGAGQIIADTYPVTLRLYGDGVLRHTASVPSATPFRLPAGYTATDWQFELEGTAEVEKVVLGESIADLRNA